MKRYTQKRYEWMNRLSRLSRLRMYIAGGREIEYESEKRRADDLERRVGELKLTNFRFAIRLLKVREPIAKIASPSAPLDQDDMALAREAIAIIEGKDE